jgi:hypothetical protein
LLHCDRSRAFSGKLDTGFPLENAGTQKRSQAGARVTPSRIVPPRHLGNPASPGNFLSGSLSGAVHPDKKRLHSNSHNRKLRVVQQAPATGRRARTD